MAYNPGVADRSGELLAGGIERGFGGLIQGIMQKQERDKNLLATAKHVDGIMKVNPQLLEQLGMTPEDFSKLSAEERVGYGMGAVAGTVQRMQMESERSKQQHYQILREGNQQQNAAEQERTAAVQRGLQSIREIEQMPNLNTQQRQNMTRQKLIEAGVYPNDMEAISRAMNNMNGELGTTEDIPGTDYKGYRSGPNSMTPLPKEGQRFPPLKAEDADVPFEDWVLTVDDAEFAKRVKGMPSKQVKALMELRDKREKKTEKKVEGGTVRRFNPATGKIE